ncbi:MAG: beta-ketoacyl-[acyl-carrier-protein] synthase family protein [Pirellulales bacterium]
MNAEASVVITGLGVICPLGIGRAAVWESLLAARSALRPITSFNTAGLVAKVAGEVTDFDPAAYVKPREALKVMARDAQLTVAAAGLAHEDSAFVEGQVDPERFGVIFGGEVIRNPLEEVAAPFRASMLEGVYDFSRWGEGMNACYPLSMLKLLPNMPACHISIGNDARGPNNSICMAEASGISAIGEATRVVQRGHADQMMAGSASSRINAYDLLRRQLSEEVSPNADSERAGRPFDADRDGQIRGEGAGVLMLESRAHAEGRGAKVYAEVRGWGTAIDPQIAGRAFGGECVKNAILRALADAKLAPSDVGFVVAHGLATRKGDAAEAAALRGALPGVPVVGLKGYMGCLGVACGSVEAALAVLMLDAGHVPPTAHCDKPDAELGLDVVHGKPLTTFAPACVVVSYTAAGQATAIVLAK